MLVLDVRPLLPYDRCLLVMAFDLHIDISFFLWLRAGGGWLSGWLRLDDGELAGKYFILLVVQIDFFQACRVYIDHLLLIAT